jgi:hypothetical protein
MQHPPEFGNLPTKPVGPPEFARLTFNNIEGNRYYYVERRHVHRTPEGEIDFVIQKTSLVFTDTSLPNWKTADKVKFRLSSGRDYKKIDPEDEDATIDPVVFEERYPDADFDDYYRLMDARTEDGDLLSDPWADIEPIQPGLISFDALIDVVDAPLDADTVWAFYTVINGGKRRRRHTRGRGRHNRRLQQRLRRSRRIR